MKRIPPIVLFFIVIGCSDNQTKVQQQTITEALHLLGPTKWPNILAVYADADGYTFIIKNNGTGKLAKKITCVTNYSNLEDTLVQIDNRKFRSPKYRSLFLVNDSEVVVTYFQKIIHPSSNWQGQTPWQEINVARYQRLDRKLK